MKNRLSPLKNPRKPWNWVSVCTFSVQARNELPWIKRFLPGSRSKEPKSPGDGGARLTQPPYPSPVKVFRKKDSPPIIRRIPPKRPPPPMPVFMPTPAWATIAPVSALMDSPGSSSMVSRE